MQICDETFPSASGYFRAILALLMSEQGYTDESSQILLVGEQMVQAMPLVYAKFLCIKAKIFQLQGSDEAHAVFSQAQSIADELDLHSESELTKLIQQTKLLIVGDGEG